MQTVSVPSIASTGVPSLRARKTSTASLRATSVRRCPTVSKITNKDVISLAAASASMMAAFPALAGVENIVATQAAAGGDAGSLSTLLPWLFATGGIFAAYNITPPSARAATALAPPVMPAMPAPQPAFQPPQPIYISAPASAPAVSPINKDEVEKTQRAWGDGLVGIGMAKTQGGDFVALAEKQVDEMYAFQYVPVLFKPTKAKEIPFRSTRESALSYFVGGNPKYTEDGGFALQPWVSVVFENDTVIVRDDMTLAMGHYTFTDPKGTKAKVEYTFGFVRDPTGKARICLQHSSLPFSG